MFKRFIYLMAVASFILGGVAARAQDAGALLDLLVRKKLSPIRKLKKFGPS